ncbi:hypothetical protein [Curtobacterium sp. MCPF17_052]|uniref:hypothetical protein n=1 Tax=Curtobacterium sp. MCPF17_052 TaxID=2175655 RepID=UPI0024DF4C9C|nr:hypothetical protein [Curtobacterium sp. MCPF17_052]WIB12841.1 hypothetical protein DEJ36_01895 [Curtobacterium sp. MCPF17_052]
MSDGVVVRVLTGRGTRAADREALVAFVADVTDTAVALVRVERRCAHCGAADHGRPAAVVDGHDIGVSLSRTTGVLALAVGPSTTSRATTSSGSTSPATTDPSAIVPSAIGVDVERLSRVAAAELDAFTPGGASASRTVRVRRRRPHRVLGREGGRPETGRSGPPCRPDRGRRGARVHDAGVRRCRPGHARVQRAHRPLRRPRAAGDGPPAR